ncbi:MAG: hydroxymethylbilane synthase [Candidatus Rokubacteria bacterium]|nr:hydroxymethylbilane synthase [Candidatus Rokubacteria bacterium]
MKLRLGTRESRLALVQSEQVAVALRRLGAEVELVRITTSGDRLAHVALADLGSKAAFVKEIEEAIQDGRVDLGVHSLKDLPAVLPPGLCLAAYPPRADPADVLVSRRPGGLHGLPSGALVGTSSLRRRILLRAARPDLRVEPIRGNVDTRLRKLEEGAYDAIVLARAGLDRLGLRPATAIPLPPDEFVPAVGQGILALEARQTDREVLELLLGLDDTETRQEAEAERSFLTRLGAGCHTPVAGWARARGSRLELTGLVASVDGQTILRTSRTGPPDAAIKLGEAVADELLARGAAQLLADGEARGASTARGRHGEDRER